MGYDSFLVDFRGAGGSSDNTTTVGVRESRDVTLAINYIRELKPDRPIILYGISMGSAAILRAIARENIAPNAIILELPFARLLSVVKTRLSRSEIPAFPMGELFVFWGSIQHGFNGFTHNPVDFARQVNSPTLILYGDRDPTVERKEIDELYRNLQVTKKLIIFPTARHQLLVTVDRQLWQQNIRDFLSNIDSK